MRPEDSGPPIPVKDNDGVEHNIRTLQTYLANHDVASGPLVKTHKLPARAHTQLEAGAAGITCQRLSEEAVAVAAGVDDVLNTFIVGKQKTEPLARLAKQANLPVVIDYGDALEAVREAAKLAKRPQKHRW